MFDQIVDGKFGIEKCNEGSWNPPSITLHKDLTRDPDDFNRIIEEGACMDGVAPKMRGGCAALIEMKGNIWYWMAEDDDHYYSEMKLSVQDVKDLCKGLSYYDSRISVSIDYIQCKSTSKYHKGIKAFHTARRNGRFKFRTEDRGKTSAPLVIVETDCYESSFDASHLPERVELLVSAKIYLEDSMRCLNLRSVRNATNKSC